MAKYKFDDIAFNSTAKKKPVEEDRHTYLGLEHLDGGSLHVSRFGAEVAPIGAKLLMKKGDVLFGKRRAYQKKVAIAPFDGIFSAHGMVLRPKEDVINKDFFPFFISSDYFLDEAIRISTGSLSPTINWKALKELEFNLPDLKEQERLAKILWAAEDFKSKANKAIYATVSLKKSMFKKYFHQKTNFTLNDCIKKIIGGGTPSRDKEDNFVGQVPWATVKDIADDDVYKSTTIEYINDNAIKNSATHLIDENSLIIATRISLGKSFINTIPMCINQDLKALVLKENMHIKYVYYWHKANLENILSLSSGTTVLGIKLENLKSIPIPIPDIRKQVEIGDKLEKLDDFSAKMLKLQFHSSIVQRNLLNKNLGLN